MMIRPVSAAQKDFVEIANYCRQHGKPVFLTEGGEGDLVVMSFARYQAQNELMDLHAKLMEAEQAIENGQLFTEDEILEQMEEWRKDEEL